MGKKSASKKNRTAQFNPKNQSSAQAQSSANQPRKEVQIPSLSGGKLAPVSAVKSEVRTLNFGEQTQFIRSDILRICLLLLMVAVILVILVLVNDKTSAITTAGAHLSTFLRLK